MPDGSIRRSIAASEMGKGITEQVCLFYYTVTCITLFLCHFFAFLTPNCPISFKGVLKQLFSHDQGILKNYRLQQHKRGSQLH